MFVGAGHGQGQIAIVTNMFSENKETATQKDLELTNPFT